MRQDVKDKLSKDFKVDEETCKFYDEFYSSKIENALKIRYLSHLVSTIEDMINNIFKEKYITPILKSEHYTFEQKRALLRRNYRLYSIVLRPIRGLKNKGFVTHYNYGSIIVYNPDVLDDNEVRILIAHELGHIVNVHILRCEDTQNRANLFGFTAINGKDQFYRNEAERFIFRSELEIIDKFFKICPITKQNQA